MVPPNVENDFMENELITIVFNTKGTKDIADDLVRYVEGWGICR